MKKKFYVLIAFFVVSLLLLETVCFFAENTSASEGTTVDEWPMYRHDPQRLGVSTSSAPSTNETRWVYNATSEFDSSPAIVHGRLIIGQSNGDILAINVTTGKLIWKYMTLAGQNSMWSSPAVDSGRVYIGCRNANLYCLDESTGEIVWIAGVGNATRDGTDSSPVVKDGKLYIGSNNGTFYCINAITGNTIWTCDVMGGMFTSPSIVDNTVYITSGNSRAFALNSETGAVIWNVSITNEYTESSPAVQDGKIYFGTGNGVVCINAANGALIWNSAQNPSGMFSVARSSPALSNNRVYIGSANGTLFCLDALTGSVLWNYDTTGDMWGSPAVADGKVFIGGGMSHGAIYCLNAATGQEIWTYLLNVRSLSGPAVCDGIVYAGYGGGGLFWESSGGIVAFGPNNLAATNITLTPSVQTSYLGFKVTLSGNLTFLGNGSAIANAPIELSYSINDGQTWTDLTSALTGNDGAYSADWVPSATGNYLVKAKLAENYPYAQSEDTKTLSITPYNSQYVFSVESNSTVTSLSYNSAANQLSFSVSGESGTTGFVRATITKSLVDDISSLTVSLDGTNLQYQVSSTADSWIVYFSYSHSTHSVVVAMGSLPETSPTTNAATQPPTSNNPSTTPTPAVPELVLLPVLVVSVALTLTAFVLAKHKIKSRKTLL